MNDLNDESVQFLEPAIIYSTSKRVCNNFEGVEPIDNLNQNKSKERQKEPTP
jgi:hypothetical protein